MLINLEHCQRPRPRQRVARRPRYSRPRLPTRHDRRDQTCSVRFWTVLELPMRSAAPLLLLALAACNGSPPSDTPAPVVATNAKTVRPTVAWPARADDAALAALGSDASNVTRSPVPVLAPRARLESPRVMVD